MKFSTILEHEIFSLPGFNLNIPCNHEGEDITWMMSISRPNYTWTREDGSPLSGEKLFQKCIIIFVEIHFSISPLWNYLGVVRKNGNLELYDVDTKDSGNYSCVMSYIDPDNEEPVRSTYKHSIQGN